MVTKGILIIVSLGFRVRHSSCVKIRTLFIALSTSRFWYQQASKSLDYSAIRVLRVSVEIHILLNLNA